MTSAALSSRTLPKWSPVLRSQIATQKTSAFSTSMLFQALSWSACRIGWPGALRRGAPAARIAPASHAAPKLGRNLRPVTRNKGCGQPWTGRAFEILSANCLSPTTVGYQQGSSGLSSVPNAGLSSSGPGLTTRYDFDGDGYPDLIYNPTGNGVWYVAFGSASGYVTPISTGISGRALFGNLTGGIEDGILAAGRGPWTYDTWNGSSFTGKSTGIATDADSYGYELADVNGDGLPDLIDLNVTTVVICSKNCANSGSGPIPLSTANIITRLNTSTGGTASHQHGSKTCPSRPGSALNSFEHSPSQISYQSLIDIRSPAYSPRLQIE